MINDNDAVFAGLPEVTTEIEQEIFKGFKKYMLFENVKKGSKHFFCTACDSDFTIDRLRMLETPEENILMAARHNDFVECPHCGSTVQLKNVKMCKTQRLYKQDCEAVFVPVAKDDIWVRCFIYYTEYFDRCVGCLKKTREVFRYRLRPGSCEFFEAEHYSNGKMQWKIRKAPGEPFVWNHGFFSEKYSYCILWDESHGIKDITETFLKYSGKNEYINSRYGNLSLMKYIGWYCRHPQLEMLEKIGHHEVADELIIRNTDFKTLFDWSAAKPWALFRMPKTVYNAFKKIHPWERLDILRVYKTMGGKTADELNAARWVLDNSTMHNRWSVSRSQDFVRACRRHKITVDEAKRYIEKTQQKTGGGCWHCPGITVAEVFDLWCDYIAMAETVSKETKKPVDAFPRDLKGEHDKLIKAAEIYKNARTAAERKKRVKNEAEKLAEGVKKRFKKVDEILSGISELYTFAGEKYTVSVPKDITDILIDGLTLELCTAREGAMDRYFDRIQKRETYLLFLRLKATADIPWYLLEIEPDGTVRQKRSIGDLQYDDLEDALPFIAEWQTVIAGRISEKEKKLARKSRETRKKEYAEMRAKKLKIARGALAGQLLADVLDADLMTNKAIAG